MINIDDLREEIAHALYESSSADDGIPFEDHPALDWIYRDADVVIEVVDPYLDEDKVDG